MTVAVISTQVGGRRLGARRIAVSTAKLRTIAEAQSSADGTATDTNYMYKNSKRWVACCRSHMQHALTLCLPHSPIDQPLRLRRERGFFVFGTTRANTSGTTPTKATNGAELMLSMSRAASLSQYKYKTLTATKAVAAASMRSSGAS